MAWPSPTEFNEAVQSPQTAFSDDDLRRTQPVTDPIGLVRPYSGNFADVYQLQGPGELCWAVKCFTRAVPHLQQRYQAISDHLQQGQLSFLVHFRYLAEGVRIGGQWYPIVKMPWIQGFTLNQFVRDNLDKPALLDRLAKMWLKLAQQLRGVGAAHADLQHGNVILVPNAKTGGLSLRLIDYDGMYVPSLARSPSGEVGHPNYQHPQRLRESVYNAEVDRFAHLVIYTSLRCLALPEGKALWGRYDNSENLLFREQDFAAPQQSTLFRELWRKQPMPTRTLIGHLLLAAQGPLTRVPLLDDLIDDGLVEPLTPDQDEQVRRLLGDTAAPAFAPALATPVTPAMLMEPAVGVLVSFESTISGVPPVPAPPRQQPRRSAPPPVAIPVGKRPAPPPLPRAAAPAPTAVDWKKSLGPGAVIAAVVLLGLLLMICISIVVVLTMPPSHKSGSPQENGTPPDSTPVLQGVDQRFPWPHRVTCLTATADGNLLYTGSDEATPRVRAYDMGTGELRQTFLGPKQAVRAVAVSPRGDWVLAVAGDGLFGWEVETGQLTYTLDQPGVHCVAVSPTGQLALSGSQDGVLRSWNLAEPRNNWHLTTGHAVRGVAFDLVNPWVFAAGANGTVRLWNLPENRMLREFPIPAGADTHVSFAPQARRLLTGGADGTTQWWDLDTGQELKKLVGGKRPIRALALLPGAQLAAVSSGGVGETADVRVWNLETGLALHRLEGHKGEVPALALVAKNDVLITGGADKSLRMWPTRRGAVLPKLLPTPPDPPLHDGIAYVKELSALLEQTVEVTANVESRQSASAARRELALLAERWTRFAAVPQPPIDRASKLMAGLLDQHDAAVRLRDRQVARLANLPVNSGTNAALAVLNLHDGQLK